MDYRIASIVQILYNINRGKDQKALPLQDFLIKFGPQEEKKKQTPDEQFRIMQLWAMAMASEPDVPKVIETSTPEQDALAKARDAIKIM